MQLILLKALVFIASFCILRNAFACNGTRSIYDYPIVLKAPPALLGFKVDRFAAFAKSREGIWQRIPLQIDEINHQGDFVLEEGEPYTAKSDNGLFDENDEIVFDGRTLGETFLDDEAQKGIDPFLKNQAVFAAKASFCRKDSLLGEALILVLKHPVPFNKIPEVSFDKKSAELRSEVYQYRFQPRHPALLGEVSLIKKGDLVSVTKSSQFLMPIKTPALLPDLFFDEKDFSSEIESWRIGPIRTIVAVGVRYAAFLSLFRLHLFSELVFYRNRFQVPTPIEFIFDASQYLQPGSGIVYVVNLANGPDLSLSSNLQALPEVHPEKMIEAERLKPKQKDEPFIARAQRSDGVMRVSVTIDEKAKERVPAPFIIKKGDFQDPKKQKFWPWLGRFNGDLGLFIDFSTIRSGLYQFGLDLLLSLEANQRFTDYGNVEAEFIRISGLAAGAVEQPTRAGSARH